MTLLKFVEKTQEQIIMEEMIERLKTEPDRQWAYIHSQRNKITKDTP